MGFTVTDDVVAPSAAMDMTAGLAAVTMYRTHVGGAAAVAVSMQRGDAVQLNGEWFFPRSSGRYVFDAREMRSREVLHSRRGAVELLPARIIGADPRPSGALVSCAYGGSAGGTFGSTTINATPGLNAPAGECGLDVTGCDGVVAFVIVEAGVAWAGGSYIWNRRTAGGVWCRELAGSVGGIGTPVPVGATSFYLRDELLPVGGGRVYLELSGVTGPTTVRVELMGVGA